jgi:catechol 2,3-dioxygenase-like lactoylglutathione lyase family enzyme
MVVSLLIGTRSARYEHAMHRESLKVSLDHLAIATTDGVGLERFLEGPLGGRRDNGGEHHDHGDAFHGGQWLFPGNGKLEVLAPLNGPESRMGRFLGRHVSRIHHVTFFVDDLTRAIALARELSFDVAEGRPVDGWREAYLSPRQTFGLLFQLVDATSSYAAVGLLPHWNGFSCAPSVATPSNARIAALRLGARSRTAAERLLRDLLGGTVTKCGGELSFRWPGNTTEIRVVVDEVAAEGPIAIELAGADPAEIRRSPASDLFAA